MLRRISMLLLLLLLPPAAGAAGLQLEVIPLQHRLVHDVIPVIQPLLAPGGSVTGTADQLIIKTTPENLAEIRRVLESIDRAMRRLQITVRQDAAGQSWEREQSLSASYGGDDVNVRAGSRAPRDGLSVSVGDEDDHLRYGIRDREFTSDDRGTYSVQTVEGSTAFIEAGDVVPIRHRTVNVYPHGAVVHDSVDYHDATSGFYVLPRLNGDRVTLLVSPFMSRVQPGRVPAFEIQNAETTAAGRLGQWITIGGIDTERSDSSRGILSGSDSTRSEQRSIQVRVDELP